MIPANAKHKHYYNTILLLSIVSDILLLFCVDIISFFLSLMKKLDGPQIDKYGCPSVLVSCQPYMPYIKPYI